MAAVDVVSSYLEGVEGSRRLGHGEWGLTLPPETAAGWPLDVGLRIADELLRVQAFAAPADAAPDHGQLLFWNRHTRMIRFAVSQTGDVWIQADLPVGSVDEKLLDRVLGLVVEAAVAVRTPVPERAAGGGWLPD